MKYILWLLLPASLLAQVGASPGSLYSPAGVLSDAARDLRASRLDDVLTIVVAENASGIASGVTNTSRKSSAQNQITALAGTLAAKTPLTDLLNMNNNQQIQGQGQTSRNMTVSTTLSARVVGITYNGTLMIEGTKDIAVNSEKQTITVRGLVRPADVTAFNTVS